MAHPDWFDPNYYAQQKVEQMNDIRYLGQTDWTPESYNAELENFRDAQGRPLSGETLDDKAYTNFLACNGSQYDPSVPRSAINVSPNQYFDVGVYVQNLADYMNVHEPESAPAGGWTLDTMLQRLYGTLHMSAWEHYTAVGMFADINPSNDFNTRAYMTARVKAMNSIENSDGSLGWAGKDDWTLLDAQRYLAENSLNPIMDLYGAGASVFNLEASAPAKLTEIPADWNQWQTFPSYNPYDDVEATVQMTAGQSVYTGADGVNTRFEAVWNNATDESTIFNTDAIHGGSHSYNTLAVELDAPWPGFRGRNGANVTNIGRLDLTHGDAAPATPYTFDARNMEGVERVDLNDNGSGAISLKNLAASIKEINIHNLTAQTGAAEDASAQPRSPIQTTSMEYAPGVVSGGNDVLSLGLDNVGLENVAAPVKLAGIENLTVNALAGSSFVNLQNAAGVKSLSVTGGGDVTITNVANGIANYDASASTGNVNIAASDLKAATPVLGGSGQDTLTLTQNFKGAPANWNAIDALFVSPGVKADISGANIKGLSSLWVNTGQNVSLTNLPVTSEFTIFECLNGSRPEIELKGGVRDLNVSTAYSAAAEGGTCYAKLESDASNNVVIHSMGQGNMGGSLTFTQAAGTVNLVVPDEAAAFSASLSATRAHEFIANVTGQLNNGAILNVVDTPSSAGGAVTINASNGVAGAENAQKQITLDSDGATSLNISTGGDFALSSKSSLNAAQTVVITQDGADASFNASNVKMPNASHVTVSGGEVILGDLGNNNLARNLELAVTDSESFQAGKLQTGANANIIANISANGGVVLHDISAGGTISRIGDAHITVDAQAVSGESTVSIAGADIFIDLGGVTGDAFSATARAALSAAESINFTGAAGADYLRVEKVGVHGPSQIDLGTGADNLYINSSAVASGQNVRMDVDLGVDTVEDVLVVNGQRAGAKLGLYVDDFIEGTDEIAFSAARNLSAAQAHSLLASFGVADIPVTSSMIADFGSGKGVVYNGDLYGFNSSSNATTMVVLTGVNGGVSNLSGIPVVEPDAPDEDDAVV